MIPPTYYRSLLTPEEQESYKAIVNGLLACEQSIWIRQSIAQRDSIRNTIRAVHLDHPELFYVDFWKYRLCQALPSTGTSVMFQMLLEQDAVEPVANALSGSASELQQEMRGGMTPEQQYHRIIQRISAATTYVDSGSAFWDHTAAGPILSHRAVCEGIAKLFLFYCQRLQLPCAVVTGTLNGTPHAWNMVEHQGQRRYVDVTGLLGTARLFAHFPFALLQTEWQLRQSGYQWEADLQRTNRQIGRTNPEMERIQETT